jgi:hypothetical protein
MKCRSIAVVLLAVTCQAVLSKAFADVVARDNFDDQQTYVSRVLVPDNSMNSIPGTFTSRYDVWGVTNRSVNFEVSDDTANGFPIDSFGIAQSTKTDNFFVMMDLANPDNSNGTATAEWTFDISGYSDVHAAIDIAAVGDFENFRIEDGSPIIQDRFDFSYSIDGSAYAPLFTSTVSDRTNNGGTAVHYSVTMEDGTVRSDYYDEFQMQFVPYKDPMSINGTRLGNTLQTIAESIAGTGNTLTIRLEGESDGSYEVVLFDNLVISGTPVPEVSQLTVGMVAVLVGTVAAARRMLGTGKSS